METGTNTFLMAKTMEKTILLPEKLGLGSAVAAHVSVRVGPGSLPCPPPHQEQGTGSTRAIPAPAPGRPSGLGFGPVVDQGCGELEPGVAVASLGLGQGWQCPQGADNHSLRK